MAMKQFIELGALRIGAAIQNVGATVDFEVLSLPGGSLIAILLWSYATATGSIRRAATPRLTRRSPASVAARAPQEPGAPITRTVNESGVGAGRG